MTDDPYDLARFLHAQERDYDQALAELRRGRKETHWIWYIFPQIAGLGRSDTARRYALASLDEARAYLAHPTLGPRLRECCEALLAGASRSALDIMGTPDDLKLRSCVTLFAMVSEPGSVFGRVLEEFFGGEQDEATVRIVGG